MINFRYTPRQRITGWRRPRSRYPGVILIAATARPERVPVIPWRTAAVHQVQAGNRFHAEARRAQRVRARVHAFGCQTGSARHVKIAR